MDQIETDDLYDERGDVSRLRPLLQGDVFEGVVLPGFGDIPQLVQVVAHPCSMRQGARLLERLTVAPVRPRAAVSNWNGHLRVMPLPQLRDAKDFAAYFVDVTAAPVELLTSERRIATLSNRGIYVLQQRLIKHYTRFEADLAVLHQQSAPTLTEAELQLDWLETVLSADEQADAGAVEAERAEFEDWLRAGHPSPQERLQSEYMFVDVRRAAQREARARAAARGLT